MHVTQRHYFLMSHQQLFQQNIHLFVGICSELLAANTNIYFSVYDGFISDEAINSDS